MQAVYIEVVQINKKVVFFHLRIFCRFLMHQLYLQIGGVDKFVSHVNATLRHKHDQERLNAIVAKIESYDAVESPNDECLRVSFIASCHKIFNFFFFKLCF